MNDPTHTQGLLYTDGDALKVRRYRLRVVAGPDAGVERVLDAGTTLVGTHPGNDVVLRDATVSRYHLELQVLAQGVRLTDQDSTNGTYLGETRLGSVLVPGRARVRLGGATEIEIAPDDEAVPVGPFRGQRFGRAFGKSDAMRALFALLERVSGTESTVLLQGETGTGKEVLAEGIHRASRRRRGPFVVVDCGAVPRELLPAELFGHTRGAFTGASERRRGLADEASGGTLFLDEVGELALDLQPQLLRLIERREVRPVGATRPHKVDIRVVAATHRDLPDLVRQGRFREDLYFRLAVITVPVPPLRERPDDIPGLVRHFLEELGHADLPLDEAALAALAAHPWPGNVRELRNVVERGVSLGAGAISLAPGGPGAPLAAGPAPGGEPEGAIPGEMLDLPFKEAKGRLVAAFERAYLEALLARHHGNISRAAQEAGIDRNYIHRLVKKYGLDVPRP